MSIESLKYFFDVGTLALALLTFVFLTGVWFTGDIINKRQSEQLRQFDRDLTTAKTGLAQAQRGAAEANERTAKLLAEIQPRDLDAEQQSEIANSIRPFHPKSIGLFNVWDPDSIRLEKIFESILAQAGVTVTSRGGGSNGIGQELSEGIEIVMRDPSTSKTALDTRPLANALYESLRGKLSVSIPRLARDGEMVSSDLVIVVGVKPWAKAHPHSP